MLRRCVAVGTVWLRLHHTHDLLQLAPTLGTFVGREAVSPEPLPAADWAYAAYTHGCRHCDRPPHFGLSVAAPVSAVGARGTCSELFRSDLETRRPVGFLWVEEAHGALQQTRRQSRFRSNSGATNVMPEKTKVQV